MPKTTFISFDGIDGSGKGTAVAWLAERLRAEGLEVFAGHLRHYLGSCRLIEEEEGSGGARDFLERYRRVKALLDRAGYDVVIFDRSIVSLVASWVFWKKFFEPEEFWALTQDLFCDLNIVLDPGLKVCKERVARSQRPDSHLAKSPEYMESFAQTMAQTNAFLAPRLGNRFVVFEDNVKAVAWAADMVGRLRTHFDLHLTNACSLKCAGCAFGAGSGYRTDTAALRRIFEIIDAGFAVGIDEFHLLGGEPLILGERLLEIMRYIREKGGSMHLLTSAYTLRLADEVLELLSPGGAVFVSLDGPREVHNRRRGMDIFDNVIEFLRRAQLRGVKIRIGTVVDRVNIAQAPRVVEVLEAEGIRPQSLCFMNMSPTGGVFSGGMADPLAQYIPAGEWIEFTRALLANPEIVAKDWVKIEPAFWNKPELFGCELMQGKRRVVVMSDGGMYLCFMLTPLKPLANILEGDPTEQMLKLLSWEPQLEDRCGNGCWGGCLGYAQLFGDGVCDGRCFRTRGSQLPEHLRIPEKHARQGYVPICPCRTIRLKDLV